MIIELNVWDSQGKLRDLSEDRATIERLPEDARAALMQMVGAINAQATAEVTMVSARTEVRRLDAAYNLADAENARKNPPQSHAAAALAVSRAGRGLKSEPVKIDKAAQDALVEANQNLADARSAYNVATLEHRRCELASGQAILKWRSFLTTPDATAVVRQYQETSLQGRAARVAQGLPAEVPAAQPNHQSILDANMAARGKTAVRGRVFHGPR